MDTKGQSHSGNRHHSRPRRRAVWTAVLAMAVASVALVHWYFPSGAVEVPSGLPKYEPSPHVAFDPVVLGPESPEMQGHPAMQVSHVQIVDFDGDGRNDVLACDCARDSLFWYRQTQSHSFEERLLADDLAAPAHATLVDLDQDGDRDVLLSLLGNLMPTDEDYGELLLLENTPQGYRRQVLLDDVRRVADAQAGDLDGDGDLDIAVAVFGHTGGEVLWLENRGQSRPSDKWRLRDYLLLDRPGAIHVPLGDLDGDGDLDIVAICTQDEEELWAIENRGKGEFTRRRLDFSDNYDVGGAGLVMCDLDRDGDQDLLLPQGDNLEDQMYWPQPYHGCKWYENLGGWKFVRHQIGNLGGTYAAAPGDIDGDNDQDVVLVSLCNDWNDAQSPGVVWLENDGRQQFSSRLLSTQFTRLATVACGDLNGDGRADVVAGALHFDRLSNQRVQRLVLFLSRTGFTKNNPSDASR